MSDPNRQPNTIRIAGNPDEVFPIGRFSRDDVKTLLDDLNSSWAPYIPVFTNITVGNGTLIARHKRIGKMCDIYVELTFGSTSSVDGAASFTLPINGIDPPGTKDNGFVNMQDTGTDNFKGVLSIGETSANIKKYTVSGANIIAGNISSTVPFTWTTGDVLICYGRYEVA